MDEQTIVKKGMSPLAIIGIAVLVAIVFGGGAYVYVSSKATKEKNDLNAQISQLQSQVASLQTSTTPAPVASASPSSTPTATNNCTSTLSMNNLKDAYFATSGNLATDSFKFTNGSYTKGSVTATLDTTHYACDSADSNSVAAIFKYNDGGTGWIYYLETLSPKGTNPTMTALATLGDRVVIKSLTYVSGTITVDMLTQGPNDSAANPTQDTVVKYKLPSGGVNLVKL